MLVILDQFEEYFIYHGEETVEDEPFARQLAAAINRPNLAASFLVSLRDDALARLDRFKARIPRLFSNYLRLRPLAGEAARSAIIEPVAIWNELPAEARGGDLVSLDQGLVTAVVEEVGRGRVRLNEGGRGGAERGEAGIEAPFLQLVMTRVWEQEIGSGSRVLRARTLSDLGGAEAIVRGHLDRVMGELSAEEQRICGLIFPHLVTPSGAKIAHTVADLAGLAEVGPGQMERLLARISGSGMRLLAPVAPTDAVGTVRYEIYHDALAQAMLEWRRHWVEEREREEMEAESEQQRMELEKERRTARRLRWLAFGLTAFMILAVAAMGFAWFQMQKAEDSARRAQEQEEQAKAVGQRATRLATDLQAAVDAKAREERQRLEAEARAAELAGESERAAELRQEVASSRRESEERAQILADLGTALGAGGTVGETELAKLAERQLSAFREERDKERARAEEAEQKLAAADAELRAERDPEQTRAGEAEERLAVVQAQLTAARGTIKNLRRQAAVARPKVSQDLDQDKCYVTAFKQPLLWATSGVWSEDGKQLLVVDAMKGEILGISPSDGVILSWPEVAASLGAKVFQPQSPAQLRSSENHSSLLQNQETVEILSLNTSFEHVNTIHPQTESTSASESVAVETDANKIVSIYDHATMGEGILAFGRIEGPDAEYYNAFVHFGNSSRQQIFYRIANEEATSVMCLRNLHCLTSIQSVGFVLLFDVRPEIGRVQLGGGRFQTLPFFPGDFQVLPDLRNLPKSSPRRATTIYQRLEATATVVGLYASGGQLYILGKEAMAKSGKTAWWIVEVSPHDGVELSRALLPTGAAHLSVIPGDRHWAIIEKDSVQGVGMHHVPYMDTRSMVLVPAAWMENLPASPLGGVQREATSVLCSRLGF